MGSGERYTEVKNHRFFRPNNHRAERDHKVSEHQTEGETCHKTEGFHPAHYDDDGQNVGDEKVSVELERVGHDAGVYRYCILKLWMNRVLRCAYLKFTQQQLPARELSLQLHSMDVSSADKFELAFKEATRALSAALAVTQYALAFS